MIDRAGGQVFDFSPLQGDTIEEDLARARLLGQRDGPAARGGASLIDPLGGRADLESRVLRVLGPGAYESDPLRALRLARFAAELGFAPDEETERLTAEAAPRVAEAAGERVFAELRRLIIADGVLRASIADRLGLLRSVLPGARRPAQRRAEPLPPPRRVRHTGGARCGSIDGSTSSRPTPSCAPC